jgi:hypothetical protein
MNLPHASTGHYFGIMVGEQQSDVNRRLGLEYNNNV